MAATIKHKPTPAAASVDPVRLEIIKGAFRSAQSEMEALLERTSMSAFIREKKDYFAAFFDRAGRLVIGTNLPTFGEVIHPILARFPAETMRSGDLYAYNDCYGSNGGVSHSPDIVFVSPVFVSGELVAFAESRAHFSDIGGSRPGSIAPDATDIFQEGIIVPPVRLYKEGELNQDLFELFVRNSRFPQMVQGDTRALMAAVRLGRRRLEELFTRFGTAEVFTIIDALIAQTRQVVSQRLRETFPPGRYRFADMVDSDGQGGGPFTIRMELEAHENGHFTIDATASDDQARGAVNFLMHPTMPKMVFGIYFIASEPSLLLNQGAAEAIGEVKTRPGSILQPRFPAPLGQRGNTMGRVQSACVGLINVASGGKSLAASGVYLIYFLRGTDPETGEPFLLSDGIAVGYGGRPYADGIDAVYYVAQKNHPCEFIELSYPVRMRSYGLNCDSGGPGRWRGGCGVVREIELLHGDAILGNRMEGVTNPPWGVAGGMAGRPGRYVLNPGTANERVLPPICDGTVMHQGDVLRVETGGGGGWGHPFDREPERVQRDVIGGFVSIKRAREDYGVVLATETFELDLRATQELRGKSRWPTKLFHRGGYFDGVDW